jgi:hypothetical protein
MRSRYISHTSIILTVLTVAWLVCLALLIRKQGVPVEVLDDAYRLVKNGGALFYITYLNVVVLTLFVVILFGLLYMHFRESHPVGSLLGILFVPVYASYNLLVYFSQISFARRIILMYDGIVDQGVMEVFAGQLLQMWGNSGIAFVNNYAYAILGIPSVIFGWMMYRMNLAGKITGVLLMLNALACFLGSAGMVIGNRVLSYGSVAGGVLFLFSLIGMAVLFREKAA